MEPSKLVSSSEDERLLSLRYTEDPDYKELKTLGESKTEYSFTYNPKFLEWFTNPQQTTPYEIAIDAPEFTTTCPKTGQPDFARILVRYSPDKRCVESKSYKLYLGSFRNEGMFHEDCTNRIAKDLYDLLEPFWIEVEGKFFPRGGISFHPRVRLTRPKPVDQFGPG